MTAVLESVRPLEDFLVMPDSELAASVDAAREALGKNVIILGHHYQRNNVIRHADLTGDSYQLSVMASQTAAEYIVFCGVHFMAESADILRAPHQKVVLPDLAAGCSMADMAAPDQLEMCWRELGQMGVRTDAVVDGRAGVIPVTYINSSAAIKAFVGAHGGIVCTSTNAAAVMKWAWERGDKLLMLPDQHLGRNTGWKMGVPLDEMVVWDPNEMWGGLATEQVAKAKLLLWKGHCSVHTRFTTQQIDAFRKKYPSGKVIAHPECTLDVVQASDESGSTEYIIDAVRNSPPGSTWAVATEVHLVNRLTQEVAPDKTVITLDPFGCLCSTMFRVSPNHLLWVLDSLVDGEVVNEIVVPEEQKKWAKIALDRMLAIT